MTQQTAAKASKFRLNHSEFSQLRSSFQHRLRRNARTLGLALAGAAMLGVLPALAPLGAPAAQAQNFGQRIIQGKVVDDTGTTVNGATVFLKNLKSRNVKSFTSTQDGSFRFAQVGMVDDYEVWAEQGKKKSATRTITSFDSRKQLDFSLKLK